MNAFYVKLSNNSSNSQLHTVNNYSEDGFYILGTYESNWRKVDYRYHESAAAHGK